MLLAQTRASHEQAVLLSSLGSIWPASSAKYSSICPAHLPSCDWANVLSCQRALSSQRFWRYCSRSASSSMSSSIVSDWKAESSLRCSSVSMRLILGESMSNHSSHELSQPV